MLQYARDRFQFEANGLWACKHVRATQHARDRCAIRFSSREIELDIFELECFHVVRSASCRRKRKRPDLAAIAVLGLRYLALDNNPAIQVGAQKGPFSELLAE